MLDIDPILSHYAADCRFVRIESLGNARGMSGAQFWRLATPRGSLVLRRWPAEHPTPDRLRFIHSVLNHAARNGVRFVPAPIETRDSRTFVEHDGQLWELAPWLAGVADYKDSPSDKKLRAAMSALAQFHVATADFKPASRPSAAPAITRRLARLRELSAGGIDELARSINTSTWPELALLAHEFVATLPRVIPPAITKLEPPAAVPLRLQPCIRDIWHDHVLFTGDEVSGVIDFGAVDIDTPATDIARLLGSLAEDDAVAWQTGIDAYVRIRQLSDDELRAIPALDMFGTILAGCNWIRWVWIDQRRFGDRAQIVKRFRTIKLRCAAALEPRSGEIA
jgi:Ser/Thr protein kinase RdoA (MazF antagonist)